MHLKRSVLPLSSIPRPFLRWAGSKRLVLHELLHFVPVEYGRYFEPFLGSGALYFFLRPRTAVLADTCRDLIETYRALRDNPAAVIRYLLPLKPDKAQYYHIRDNLSSGRYKRAAQFVYLNKTCWNGLYRVNSNGRFNVPFGRPKTDNIFDQENLQACGDLLSSSELAVADFELAVATAQKGDFVFLDPPYVTGHRSNGFIDYNEVLFSWQDQLRLAEVANELRLRGVRVLLTNADNDAIKCLYPDFLSFRFERKATIAGNAARRGRTTELIITSN